MGTLVDSITPLGEDEGALAAATMIFECACILASLLVFVLTALGAFSVVEKLFSAVRFSMPMRRSFLTLRMTEAGPYPGTGMQCGPLAVIQPASGKAKAWRLPSPLGFSAVCMWSRVASPSTTYSRNQEVLCFRTLVLPEAGLIARRPHCIPILSSQGKVEHQLMLCAAIAVDSHTPTKPHSFSMPVYCRSRSSRPSSALTMETLNQVGFSWGARTPVVSSQAWRVRSMKRSALKEPI